MRINCANLALWIGAGWLLGIAAPPCWAQPGPDDGGAVVRNPFDEPAPRVVPRSKVPNQPETPAPSGGDTNSSATLDRVLANLTVDPRYAVNNDIRATEKLGPWMICVHSYVTKEAADWARQMTSELRGNPKYRLPAYVYTYGLEERQKEYLRVKKMLDQQRDFVKEKGLPIMVAPNAKRGAAPELSNTLSFEEMLKLVGTGSTGPMESDDLPLQYALSLLKVKHIQVQCAVLVGGYASEDAAHRALTTVRNLPPPDPNKVKLDVKFYSKGESPSQKTTDAEGVYVNPFKKAFVCRNPSIKQDRVEQDGLDIKLLRKLNHDEPLTLLNSKKPITLAIKQFQTYTHVQSKDQGGSILDKFGANTRSGEGVDQAAHDGHNLAEFLRKNKLEAYVLHTKYASIVTVGGYDSLEDPNLRAMQSTLETRLRSPEWARLLFFPRPMPMKVPQ